VTRLVPCLSRLVRDRLVRDGHVLVPRWALAAVLATALLLGAAGCGGRPAGRLYADPGRPLLAAAAQLRATGHPAQAAELRAVAETPAGIWAAGQPGDIQAVRRVARAAARTGAIPVIVAYNLPDRDACGHFSASSGPTAAGYQTWINQLAAAIGSSDVIVVVEPDAVADLLTGCLDPAQQAERYQLLRYAMRRLGALPRAQVYLDAGNPGMLPDPTVLVRPLEQAGIRDGSGFSANVSNFQWTADVVPWAQRLEHALGGRVAAVIDTSRNGRGPYTGPDAPQWCNPPGRALGRRPTLDPGPAGIAAYLWIKDPGVSDGTCNGGPPAGDYWPQYALSLIQQALAEARAPSRVALS
jgi:endoglucanase